MSAAFFGAGLRVSGSGPTAGLGNGADSGVIDAFNAAGGRNVLVVTYDLQLANTTQANTVFANETLTNLATLSGYSGQANGTNFIANAPLTDPASVTVRGPTVAKTLVGTSINDATNNANQAVIGETASYLLTVNVPEGVTNGFNLIDVMPAGLAFAQITAVTTTGGVTTSLTPGVGPVPLIGGATPGNVTVNGNNTVTMSFGTVTNPNAGNGTTAGTITVAYNAVVLNTNANVRGTTLVNAANATYTSGNLTLTAPTSNAAAVTLLEPTVTVGKTFTVNGAVAANAQAGDTVAYTVTLADPAANSTTAYDVALSDVLPTGAIDFGATPTITYVSGPARFSNASFSLVNTGNGGLTLQTAAPLGNLTPGETITLRLSNGTIRGSVLPNQLITNDANDTWTSLPGTPGNQSQYSVNAVERTGNAADPGQRNNYNGTAFANLTIFTPQPTKSLVVTSEPSTLNANVTIGEVPTYRLVVQVPRATLPTFNFVDALPNGLGFNANTARLSFVSASAGEITSTTLGAVPTITTGLPAANVPLNANNSLLLPGSAVSLVGNTLTLSLGNVTNTAPVTDPGPEYAVIDFEAVVQNVANNTGGVPSGRLGAATVLVNTFQTFVNGAQNGPTSVAANVTVVEPKVTVLKTVGNATPDAGDVVTYTVKLTNGGNADAFDTTLADVLPAFLANTTIANVAGAGLGVGNFTIANGTLQVNAATDPSGIFLSRLAGNNAVTINVQGTLLQGVNPGQVVPNTANVTYTSEPGPNGTGNATPGAAGSPTGERTGNGTNPNLYTSTSTVNLTVPKPTLAKSLFGTSLVDTAAANVTIGESETFALKVTLPQGTTPGLVLTDALPAGEVFTGFSVVTTAAGSIDFTGVQLLAGDFLGTGVSAANITQTLSGNSPVFTFNGNVTATGGAGDGQQHVPAAGDDAGGERGEQPRPGRQPDAADGHGQRQLRRHQPGALANTSVTLTVVEPQVLVTKSFGNATGDAGDAETITITAKNTGTSTSYDTVVQDVLPPQFAASAVANATPAGFTFSFNPGNQTVTYTGGNITPGATLTFSFNTVLNATVVPNQTVLNQANAPQVTSLPGVDPAERNTPSNVANATLSVPNASVVKSIANTSLADTLGANVAVGEFITYSLAVTLPEGTTPNLTITDALPANVTFAGGLAVNTTGFNGNGAAITGSSFAGGLLTITFANPINVIGDNVAGNNTFLVTFDTQVVNAGTNHGFVGNQTNLPNAATVTAGNAPPVTSNFANATVVEPKLTVVKTLLNADQTVDAGTTLNYQVVLTNSAAAGSTGPAFNINLADALASVGLALSAGSVSVAAPGYVATTNTSNAAGVNLAFDELKLGDTITVTYTRRAQRLDLQRHHPGAGQRRDEHGQRQLHDRAERRQPHRAADLRPGQLHRQRLHAQRPRLLRRQQRRRVQRGPGRHAHRRPERHAEPDRHGRAGHRLRRQRHDGDGRVHVHRPAAGHVPRGGGQPAGRVPRRQGHRRHVRQRYARHRGHADPHRQDRPRERPAGGRRHLGRHDPDERRPERRGQRRHQLQLRRAEAGGPGRLRLPGHQRQRPAGRRRTGRQRHRRHADGHRRHRRHPDAERDHGQRRRLRLRRPAAGQLHGHLRQHRRERDVCVHPAERGQHHQRQRQQRQPHDRRDRPHHPGGQPDRPDRGRRPVRPVSIGNRVFYDVNGNGTQEAGEPGIANVTVTLTGTDGAGNPVSANTTTNATGNYSFTGLAPGTYTVSVVPAGVPSGLTSNTTPVVQPTGFLPSGTNDPNQNFGFRGNATLGDRVWLDANGNATQDVGEPGIPGVGVTATWLGFDGVLGGGDDIAFTTVTGANGIYGFGNLPAGNYVVAVNAATLPSNAVETFDLNGPLDNKANRTLTLGQNATDVDFGYRGQASVGNTMWYDVNGNGVQDNAEPGIANATLQLDSPGADGILGNADDILQVTTTDVNGKYTFVGVPVYGANQTQSVTVTSLPAGFTTQTFDLDGVGTPNTANFTLGQVQNRTDVDFGYRGNAATGLGDFVWQDNNGNGRQDPGEPGVANITVNLLDSDRRVPGKHDDQRQRPVRLRQPGPGQLPGAAGQRRRQHDVHPHRRCTRPWPTPRPTATPT